MNIPGTGFGLENPIYFIPRFTVVGKRKKLAKSRNSNFGGMCQFFHMVNRGSSCVISQKNKQLGFVFKYILDAHSKRLRQVAKNN